MAFIVAKYKLQMTTRLINAINERLKLKPGEQIHSAYVLVREASDLVEFDLPKPKKKKPRGRRVK